MRAATQIPMMEFPTEEFSATTLTAGSRREPRDQQTEREMDPGSPLRGFRDDIPRISNSFAARPMTGRR
jgi:hypothetical protein